MLCPDGKDKFTISLNFPGRFFLGMNPMGLRWMPSRGEGARLPALISSSMYSSTLEANAKAEGELEFEETSVAKGLTPKRKPSRIPLLRKAASCGSGRILSTGSHSFSGRKPRGLAAGVVVGADATSSVRRFCIKAYEPSDMFVATAEGERKIGVSGRTERA